jgi:hypothetical protein
LEHFRETVSLVKIPFWAFLLLSSSGLLVGYRSVLLILYNSFTQYLDTSLFALLTRQFLQNTWGDSSRLSLRFRHISTDGCKEYVSEYTCAKLRAFE